MGDKSERAAPFEDGAFEVAGARSPSLGVGQREFAMQDKASENFGAAFSETLGQAVAQVPLGREGFKGQAAASPESAAAAPARGDPFTGTELGWGLRWFTPTTAVELCGHATLAAGYVVLRGAPGASVSLAGQRCVAPVDLLVGDELVVDGVPVEVLA